MTNPSTTSLILLACLLACAGCSDPGPSAGDAALDGASAHDAHDTLCTTDHDCDDGHFCNGAETCDPIAPTSADDGCVPAAHPACAAAAGTACDEANDRCVSCADADADGASAESCGGTDCDDANPARAPGNTEVCDTASVDEDCDPSTFGFRDVDGDGAADATCCNGAAGAQHCGTDCNDHDPTVNPTNAEVCDGIDNNCDGLIDDVEPPSPWYLDADGDGHGAAADVVSSCVPVTGRVLVADDCDDSSAMRYPLANEVCDGADDDCDTLVDEAIVGTIGTDCNVAGAMGACALGHVACHGATGLLCDAVTGPVAETCNGVNDDCDGATDEAVPGVGGACSVGGAHGACAAGTMTCLGVSGISCQGPAPRGELCSAANENCDAAEDGYDGLTCRPGQTQSCNVCATGSSPGSQSCDGGCAWSSCRSSGYSETWYANSPDLYSRPVPDASWRAPVLLASCGGGGPCWSCRNAFRGNGWGDFITPARTLAPGLYRATWSIYTDTVPNFLRSHVYSSSVDIVPYTYIDFYTPGYQDITQDFRVDTCRDVQVESGWSSSTSEFGSSMSLWWFSVTVTRIAD